ncbi:hypothetical protein J4573_52150 [Actinomadura barringtoniae]|uniref:DUF6801 domain-containing protein n=1 Tax=Actinomadura barringtoniae TaxID=1427535 RepID=A0A939TGS4_9ACTN|nr:DUF6801 domain-containing protein [Actinomadura barringtoniae]MBO2455710.1 hypothetical protein [Actinomadura barringtoniae]
MLKQAGIIAVAALGALPVAGPVSAAPTTKSFTFTCAFPNVGDRQVKVEYDTDFPASVPAGEPMPGSTLTARVPVSDSLAAELRQNQDLNLEDTEALRNLTITDSQGRRPLRYTDAPHPLVLADLLGSGTRTASYTAVTNGPTFTKPGDVTIETGPLVLSMLSGHWIPLPPDGLPGLITDWAPCNPDPGQDLTLGKVQVTPAPPKKLDFGVKGTTSLRGSEPIALSGSLKSEYDASTGEVSGDLSLDPVTGHFSIAGFIPATADLAFSPAGRTTGTFNGKTAGLSSPMNIGLTSITAFGIPVGGGTDCRTTAPVQFNATGSASDDYSAEVSGDYELPAFENCGPLTFLVNAFLPGSGNPLKLSLTR